MYAFGFLGLTVGVYLIDCALHGRPPVQTFKAILTHPGDIEAVLEAYTDQMKPEPYDG